jgi:thioredoxin-related protein
MKKLTLIIIILVACISVKSQSVLFRDHETWKSLKARAKKENKFIFIDAYATWCGPCKQMDSVVYTVDSVGNYFNKNFISLKLQIDRTPNDNENIKMLYKDAEWIKSEYKIQVVPTVLFFNQEGEILLKDAGFKDAASMLELGRKSLDPQNQYYMLIRRYKENKTSLDELPDLAKKVDAMGHKALSIEIASKYINNYLLKENSKNLTAKNLKFMGEFLGSTNSRAFKYFVKNIKTINDSLGPHRAEYNIKSAITKEFFPTEEMWPKDSTKWDSLTSYLTIKFGTLGAEVSNGNRMLANFYAKNWINFGKYYKSYLETALKRPDYDVNDITFEIFKYVDDKKVLEYACNVVMKFALEEWYQNNAAAYDTYAQLLYKNNSREEAIKWEEKAIKIMKGSPDLTSYTDVIDKMKKGIPTWKEPSSN